MFVHDFVRLNLPYEEVVARFGSNVDPWLGMLVASAWRNDMPTWIASGVDEADLAPPAIVPVWLGAPRQRNDATIVPIAWPPVGGRFVSGLDADIEIVACGPEYTDVQLLGRYEFADGVERWTADASLAHRIAVSVVRRFLGLLADRLLPIVSLPNDSSPTIDRWWWSRPPRRTASNSGGRPSRTDSFQQLPQIGAVTRGTIVR